MNRMHRRRGLFSLWLLLALSAFIAALSGILFAAAHTVRTEEAVRQGLRAQYAAESGAVFGLAHVKTHGVLEKTAEWAEDEASRWTVQIRRTAAGAEIRSKGEDTASGALRYVKLTVSVTEENGRRVLVVKEVENGKW